MGNRYTTPESAGIEIRAIAELLDAAHICDSVAASAAHDQAVTGQSRQNVSSRAVPAWHTDLDRVWRDRRAQLVAALRDNAQRLRRSADSYRAADQAVADMFAELLCRLDPTKPSHPPSLPVDHARGDPHHGASSALSDGDGDGDGDGDLDPANTGGLPRPPVSVEPADTQIAAQTWRLRRDDAEHVAAILSGDELRAHWRGSAADAHAVWVADHQQRWQALAADADTVERALTRHHPSGSEEPAPELSPSHSEPRHSAVAQPEIWTPADAHPSTSPSSSDPDSAGLRPAAAGPDINAPGSASTAGPATAGATVPVPAPPAVLSTEEPPARPVSDSTDPRTDHHPDHRIEGAPQSDLPSGASSHAPATTDTAPHGETPSAAPGSSAFPAAAASAAAFARADRSLHVVREIPVPPPATPTPPGSSQAPNGPAAPSSPSLPGSPLPASNPLSPTTGPAVVAERTPTDVPDLPAPAGTAGGRATARRPRPGRHDHDPAQPDPTGPDGLWIDLAAPDAAEPLWIDLTATGGLGIDGPGMDDLTRTLLARLLTPRRAVAVVIPDTVLAHLTREHDHPGVRTGAGTGGEIANLAAVAVGLQPVTHPAHGLRWLVEQTRDRERAEHRARLAHAGHTATKPPAVLLVPAPTAAHARTQLVEAIDRARHHGLAAIIGGPWGPGTNLHVTEHQQVANHTTATGSPYPDFTGHYLHPTTPAELRERLLHPDRTGTDGTSAADRGSGDMAADPEAHIVGVLTHPAAEPGTGSDDEESGAESGADRPRTPLALTVLGPVALYSRHTCGTGVREHDASDATAVAVGPARARHRIDVPAVASELLAFLAAHPEGVTRDTIVAALWPDTTADRPATALHTTLSRLRKRLRDATGTSEAGDLVATTGGRWSLNTHIVTVDYWTFLETRTQPPSNQALETAVAIYAGPFAADQIGEWTHAVREATRRRYLEALHDLAELEIAAAPDRALKILETARNLEPLNEEIYRTIIQIHRHHGRRESAEHTYRLLETCLAAIDTEPDPRTQRLARQISPT